jgi:hypothetical protein
MQYFQHTVPFPRLWRRGFRISELFLATEFLKKAASFRFATNDLRMKNVKKRPLRKGNALGKRLRKMQVPS